MAPNVGRDNSDYLGSIHRWIERENNGVPFYSLYFCDHGRRENSEAPGQKKEKPPASETIRKFSGYTNFLWKFLLTYFMSPQDFKGVGVPLPSPCLCQGNFG